MSDRQDSLKPFPPFPKCHAEDFGRPELKVQVRGTTIGEVNFSTGSVRTWRVLSVSLVKLGQIHGRELPEVDFDDLRFFRDNYFKATQEVFFAIPERGKPSTSFRLYAIERGAPVLPRVVRLSMGERNDAAQVEFVGSDDADPAAAAQDLGEGAPPAEGEGQADGPADPASGRTV